MAYSPEIAPAGREPLQNVEGKKMTKARLAELLQNLDLQYSINGEGSDFEIVIALPEAHIAEKENLRAGPFSNQVESLYTQFETEKVHPLMRAIKMSNNLDCTLGRELDQYRVRVSKK